MLTSLVQLLVVLIIVGVAWWLVDFIPIPEPLNKIAKIIIIVIGVIILLYTLLAVAGMAPGFALK